MRWGLLLAHLSDAERRLIRRLTATYGHGAHNA